MTGVTPVDEVDTISWPSDSSESGNDDPEPTPSPQPPCTESSLQLLLLDSLSEVTKIIDELYEFSLTIRNSVSSQRDRSKKYAGIDVSGYEFFDIGHVSNKFPAVGDYLAERLGKANTRRRQLLIYNKKHRDKIAKTQAADFPKEVGKYNIITGTTTIIDGPVGPPTAITSSSTLISQTTVSTYVEKAVDSYAKDIEPDTDSHSITSYAPSSCLIQENGRPARLIPVPDPPHPDSAFDGQPFECQFCYHIIKVSDRRSWM